MGDIAGDVGVVVYVMCHTTPEVEFIVSKSSLSALMANIWLHCEGLSIQCRYLNRAINC